MPDETVMVGDTEVEIRETDDGFEAVEAEDEPEGPFLEASDNGGSYGFKVPLADALDGAVAIERRSGDPYKNPFKAAWDTDADVSGRKASGNSKAKDLRNDQRDGYAVLEAPQVVDE